MKETPKASGYYFPAEWGHHRSTWLTFPVHEDSFPGRMKEAANAYLDFVAAIARDEQVNLIVHDSRWEKVVSSLVEEKGIARQQVRLWVHPTNDVWCRDHGPAFLLNRDVNAGRAIIDWEFNAWGSKYASSNDNDIPGFVASRSKLPLYQPKIVMEGGSVDFNGQGTILTTSACLLNKNRNPHLSQKEIEWYLCQYYGADQVLWLHDGIAGDDTDGHIDDITRFVSETGVVTMVEPDKSDVNHGILRENLEMLRSFRLTGGRALDIVEIPMPVPVFYEGQRLPASYANFYITNRSIIVPVFGCRQDYQAVDTLKQLFPGREIVAIDSTVLVWGFGSFHCLSQQEADYSSML